MHFGNLFGGIGLAGRNARVVKTDLPKREVELYIGGGQTILVRIAKETHLVMEDANWDEAKKRYQQETPGQVITTERYFHDGGNIADLKDNSRLMLIDPKGDNLANLKIGDTFWGGIFIQ